MKQSKKFVLVWASTLALGGSAWANTQPVDNLNLNNIPSAYCGFCYNGEPYTDANVKDEKSCKGSWVTNTEAQTRLASSCKNPTGKSVGSAATPASSSGNSTVTVSPEGTIVIQTNGQSADQQAQNNNDDASRVFNSYSKDPENQRLNQNLIDKEKAASDTRAQLKYQKTLEKKFDNDYANRKGGPNDERQYSEDPEKYDAYVSDRETYKVDKDLSVKRSVYEQTQKEKIGKAFDDSNTKTPGGPYDPRQTSDNKQEREQYLDAKKKYDADRSAAIDKQYKAPKDDELNKAPKDDEPKSNENPLRKANRELRQAKREVKRKAREDARGEEIQLKNTSGKYGGRYGGFDGDISNTISQGAHEGAKMYEQGSAQNLEKKKNELMADMTGKMISSKEMGEQQQKLTDAAKSQLQENITVNRAVSAADYLLGGLHVASIMKVKAAKMNAEAAIKKDEIRDVVAPMAMTTFFGTAPVDTSAAEASINRRKKNVAENFKGESKAQLLLLARQGMAGVQANMAAARFKAEKDALLNLNYQNQNQAPQNQGFTITGGSPVGNPQVDPAAGPDATQSALVADAGSGDSGKLGDSPQINPGSMDALPEGPQANAFQSQNAPSGGGGGGGRGSAQGTSAAAPDSGDGSQAPTRGTREGGNYASDGGGSSGSNARARGDSSGGSVGVDDSFANLLKKFLPGGEDEKAKPQDPAALAFNDRAPASDQAAVMGRNKNIFDAIHSRYVKKLTEGAVVFKDQ